MKKFLLTLMLLPALCASATLTSYTITFQGQTSGTSDGAEITESDVLKKQLTSGSDCVSSFTDFSKVYSGKYSSTYEYGLGLKLGSSKAIGKFTANLSDKGKVKATKLSVTVAKYGSDTGDVKVTINKDDYTVKSTAMGTSADVLIEHEFDIKEADQVVIESIKVATSSKRAYVKSIKVYYDDGTVSTDPMISAPSNLAFGVAEEGEEKSITVTAENLTADISATWRDRGKFTCVNADELGKTGGELTIKLVATAGGTHTDELTLTSGTASVTVNVSATIMKTEGDGSFENPYTVADVIMLNNSKSGTFWVRGYIRGAYNNNAYESSTTTVSNIALGKTATTTSADDVIPVELASGSIYRDALKATNTGNMGTEVMVKGNLVAYFGLPGVKSLSDYAFYTEDAYVVADDKANVEKNTRVASVTYERADLDLSKWHSICLPFAVPAEKWASDYKVITLSETQETEGAVDFNYVATYATLAAKTPYLIKAVDPATTAISVLLSDPLIIYAGTTKVSDGSYVHLHGTLAETDLQDNTTYLYYALKDGVFRNAGTESVKTLGRYRAYLEVTATQGKPQLQVNVEGETSGIEAVTTNAAMEDGVFYNLKGQRVDNPDKGIYIFNGMKVIIK